MALMIIGEASWSDYGKEVASDAKAKARKGVEEKARDAGKSAFDKVTGYFGSKLGIKKKSTGGCSASEFAAIFRKAYFALNNVYVGKASLPVEIQASLVSIAIAARDALALADGSRWQSWLPVNMMNMSESEIAANKEVQMYFYKGFHNVANEISKGTYEPPAKLQAQMQKMCMSLLPYTEEAKAAVKEGYLKTTYTPPPSVSKKTKKTLLYVGGAVAAVGAVAAFAKFKGII